MRKVLLAIAIIVSAISYAYNIECVGNVVLLENNGDTLLVFEKNPELKSSDGKPIAWYSVADTLRPIQTSTYLDYNAIDEIKSISKMKAEQKRQNEEQ